MNNLKYIIRFCESLSNEYVVELYVSRNNPKYGNVRLLIDTWRGYTPFTLMGDAAVKLIHLTKTMSNIENILDFESFTKFGDMTAKDIMLRILKTKYHLSEISDRESAEKTIKTMMGTEIDTKVHDNKVLFYMESILDITAFKKDMMDDLILDLKEEDPVLGTKLKEHLDETLKVETVTDEQIYCVRYVHSDTELTDEVKLLILAWIQGCHSEMFNLISVPTCYTDSIITLANESIKSKIGKEDS